MMKPNPIGEVYQELLKDSIDEIIQSWKETNPQLSWWERVVSTVKGVWIDAVAYLMTATDYFIQKIDGLLENGPDKKATVIDAIGKVYDVIVPDLLPIALRPFNKQIKHFILNVVISITIDFIVSKYRNGAWSHKNPEETVELPEPTIENNVELT